MNGINLNTFAPAQSVGSTQKRLPCFSPGQSIAVIGAGAFGGWTALSLLRRNFNVTLIDAWGPGNSRSSSGDETRVIRSTYGANEHYFKLNVRALELWKENEKRFGKKLFHNSGVLWFCHHKSTPLVDDSIPYAQQHGMPYEYLTPDQIRKRFPMVNTEDLHHAYFDPYGGYLKAREACIAVQEAFVNEGGKFIQASVTPGPVETKHMEKLRLHTGEQINADAYIFACGAWLRTLFPSLLSTIITCTKQEVYFFGVPATQAKYYDEFPVWIDADGKDNYYGIAGNASRGFKIGVDKRGEAFDPTAGERILSARVLQEARIFLHHRFPGLTESPLLESRVCPYENSPTGNFIFDLHPGTENLFILGGGSGHGFKHGPALGELVANILRGALPLPPAFNLPVNI